MQQAIVCSLADCHEQSYVQGSVSMHDGAHSIQERELFIRTAAPQATEPIFDDVPREDPDFDVIQVLGRFWKSPHESRVWRKRALFRPGF